MTHCHQNNHHGGLGGAFRPRLGHPMHFGGLGAVHRFGHHTRFTSFFNYPNRHNSGIEILSPFGAGCESAPPFCGLNGLPNACGEGQPAGPCETPPDSGLDPNAQLAGPGNTNPANDSPPAQDDNADSATPNPANTDNAGNSGSNQSAMMAQMMQMFQGMLSQLANEMQAMMGAVMRSAGIQAPNTGNNSDMDSLQPDNKGYENNVAALQSGPLTRGNAPDHSQYDFNNLDTTTMPGNDIFDKACNFTLKWEGAEVTDEGNGLHSQWGVDDHDLSDYNQRHGTHLAVGALSKDNARLVMKDKYWGPSGAAQIAQTNPKLAIAVFDTAFNNGIGAANRLLKQSGGDLNQFCQLRRQLYYHIAEEKPGKARDLPGWINRENDLERTLAT